MQSPVSGTLSIPCVFADAASTIAGYVDLYFFSFLIGYCSCCHCTIVFACSAIALVDCCFI